MIDLRSVLKTNSTRFRPLEEQSILQQCGKNLRIFDWSQKQSQFLSLHRETLEVLDFGHSPNLKHMFTV